MAIKDTKIFLDLFEQSKKEYENIFNTKELNENDKLEKIQLLMTKDNTQESIILFFLKLKKNEIQNSVEFMNLLSYYQCCIQEETFNSNFGNYFKKISAFQKFINLFKNLNKLFIIEDIEEKIFYFNDNFIFNPIKYIPKLPILYKINEELYLDTLYNLLIKEIKKNIDNYLKEEINSNEYEKLYNYYFNCKMIIIEKVDKEDLKEVEKKLKKYNIILKYLPLFYNNFENYISKFSYFISNISENFFKKFKNQNDITQEIELFTDLIFFLMNFNFEKNQKYYIEIWNESLIEKTNIQIQKELKELSNNILKYQLEGNTIIVNNIKLKKKRQIKFDNVNNYCMKLIIQNFDLINENPSKFMLNKYLKINKYPQNIFIKLSWNNYVSYLSKIMTSKVINSIASKIYDKENYNIFNEKDIRYILENSRYFIFDSDFTGYTKGRLLLVYIKGILYYDNFNENLNKLFNLTVNIIINIHEITGHLNLRIQNFLYKKKYTSPKPLKGTQYAQNRNKESGEYIEEQLFGRVLEILTIKEMLYILDLKNYNCDFEIFKKKFMRCNDEKIDISNELNIILNLYEINISKININDSNKYRLLRNINNNTMLVPSRHPLNYTGYDDDF